MPDYRQVFAREGYRWPSGDCRSAATFSITPEAMSARTGLKFESGVNDLDHFRAAGVELPSGRRVNLLWYERAPILSLELQIDSADDLAAAREELMRVLGVEARELSWMPNVDEAAS